jgi:F-type H+-transporting ATPase subunit a
VGGILGGLFNIIWKLFDMFIGAIQAFIFALLTVLYFGMAGGDHDEHDESPAKAEDKRRDKAEAEDQDQASSEDEKEPALAS